METFRGGRGGGLSISGRSYMWSPTNSYGNNNNNYCNIKVRLVCIMILHSYNSHSCIKL